MIKRDIDRFAYEIYMSDCLRVIAGVSERYFDWISGKTAERDTRTGDEIDRELCEKFGWEVSG